MSVKLTQPQKEMIKVILYDNYTKIKKLKNKYNIAFQVDKNIYSTIIMEKVGL